MAQENIKTGDFLNHPKLVYSSPRPIPPVVSSPRTRPIPPVVSSPSSRSIPPVVSSPRTRPIPPAVSSPGSRPIPPVVPISTSAIKRPIPPIVPISTAASKRLFSPISPISTSPGSHNSTIVRPIVPISTKHNIVVPTIPRVISKTLKTVVDLTLRDYQNDWANRGKAILDQYPGYLDTSRMGAGKTFVTLWQAIRMKLPIIVICPTSVQNNWMTNAPIYGVEVVSLLTYEGLRSIKGKQPKHGLLKREDYTKTSKKPGKYGGPPKVKQITEFTATQRYLDLIEKGVFVVFDEIQKAKNKTSQHLACKAMIAPIVNSSRSKYALLSGTPFDKPEHAINVLRMMGIIKSSKMRKYNIGKNEIELLGIAEVVNYCKTLDEKATMEVLKNEDFADLKSAKADEFTYEMFVKVIKPAVAGSMPAPTTIPYDLDIKCGFFDIKDPENMTNFRNAVMRLERITFFDERTALTNFTKDSMKAVTGALVEIEKSKTDDMARIAREILENKPRSKVILCVNYIDVMTKLKILLSEYSPLILNGKVPAKTRTTITNKFNDNFEYRVLIMNTAVGGLGINLHDTVGDSPRFMLISPDYRMLNIAQATYRIYRDGTLSPATVRLFYGNDNIKEYLIINAMAKKSQTTRGILDVDSSDTFKLPGEYDTENETDFFQNLISD